MGPARQPHGPNNGAAHANRIQTSAAAALPPLVSRSPAAIHAAICQPPPVAIKGVHPSPLEQPFPPPPLVAATTPSCLPSLSCRKPPPWSPFEPPNTTPSSAPTPGAPSTPLSAPLAAPLRHHRRSPPLGLCRHGNPCTDEPLPPQTPQTGSLSHRLPLATSAAHLIAGHCWNQPVLPAPVRHGSSLAPGSGLPAHEPDGWELGRANVGPGEQSIFSFSKDLIQVNSNIVQTY
jgi:hypothetical protein